MLRLHLIEPKLILPTKLCIPVYSISPKALKTFTYVIYCAIFINPFIIEKWQSNMFFNTCVVVLDLEWSGYLIFIQITGMICMKMSLKETHFGVEDNSLQFCPYIFVDTHLTLIYSPIEIISFVIWRFLSIKFNLFSKRDPCYFEPCTIYT